MVPKSQILNTTSPSHPRTLYAAAALGVEFVRVRRIDRTPVTSETQAEGGLAG
jgi:hypothetical protein